MDHLQAPSGVQDAEPVDTHVGVDAVLSGELKATVYDLVDRAVAAPEKHQSVEQDVVRQMGRSIYSEIRSIIIQEYLLDFPLPAANQVTLVRVGSWLSKS